MLNKEIYKIGIIGHIGGKQQIVDGQTIKTLSVIKLFNDCNYKNFKLTEADTYYLKKNPFKFLFNFTKCVLFNKKIIVLLSSNGRKYLFPVLYILSKYFKKEIYHYAIGGRLYNEITSNNKEKKYVSSFSGNWVESVKLTDDLIKCGLKNAAYIPNFKFYNKEINNNSVDLENNYKFCIFSRITKKKGIIDAIEAIQRTSKNYKVTLDIYGPIDEDFKNEFFNSLNTASECCFYKGIVEPCDSIGIIKNYYCLLFPTHWKHEGIPGTIIDSLTAGVPVISRKWQYCDEMLQDKFNGYVYDFDSPEKLYDCIVYSINHKSETLLMKVNCIDSSKKYDAQNVLNQILKEMKI